MTKAVLFSSNVGDINADLAFVNNFAVTAQALFASFYSNSSLIRQCKRKSSHRLQPPDTSKTNGKKEGRKACISFTGQEFIRKSLGITT